MLDDPTGDQPDLNLAESAPMTLDADVFDGLLDYALSADAHDVDDSIVPDDLDAIALADDVDDPLDSPLDDGHADPSALPDSHDGGVADEDFGLPADMSPDSHDLPVDPADDFAGIDDGVVDGGDVDPSSSDSDLDW